MESIDRSHFERSYNITDFTEGLGCIELNESRMLCNMIHVMYISYRVSKLPYHNNTNLYNIFLHDFLLHPPRRSGDDGDFRTHAIHSSVVVHLKLNYR